MTTPDDLVTPNLGIIAKLARRYWVGIPPNIKRFYTTDDMISEVALHVLLRQDCYNRQRAAPVTFVYWVADRYCQVIVQRYHAQKRSAPIVSLDTVADIAFAGVPESYRTHAIEAVEAVIGTGSDALRAFLSQLLQEGCAKPPDPSVAAEFRMVARVHRATWRDFLLVRHMIVDKPFQ